MNRLAKELYGDHYVKLIDSKDIDWRVSCTGRTTASILGDIAYCLLNPSIPVQLKIDTNETPIRNKYYFEEAEKVVSKLGLRFIKFNKATLTMKYEIFNENAVDSVDLSGIKKALNDLTKAVEALQ